MSGLSIEYQQEIARQIAAGATALADRINQAPDQRAQLTRTMGYSLLEAPTGAGKTRILADALSRIAEDVDVVCFWFAPFAGVINQTKASIVTSFPTLRVRRPDLDRLPETTRAGDTFVMTWGTVAVSNREGRRVRVDGDGPSIDTYIKDVRRQGFLIAAVVDEAHANFRPGNQAFRFWTEVLKPDIAILATATPGDQQMSQVRAALRLADINHFSVSRRQGVDAGLIKSNATTVICTPRNRVAGAAELDPFEVALRAGAQQHERVKAALAALQIPLVPLLLVQAGGEWTPERVASFLANDCGLGVEAVRTHTSDEPDPQLASIAGDQRCEALVFKMAVATGFDAPRAFTLVSLRNIISRDFGTQIIGRIMRVPPELRSQVLRAGDRGLLPLLLDTGFIFLVAEGGQEGLAAAAAQIQSLRPRLRSVAGEVAVLVAGEVTTIIAPGRDLVSAIQDAVDIDQTLAPVGTSPAAQEAQRVDAAIGDLYGFDPAYTQAAAANGRRAVAFGSETAALHRYRLRDHAPRRLLTERLPTETDDVPAAIAAAVEFSPEQLLLHNRQFTQVIVEERDLFEACERRRSFGRIEISERRVAQVAQSAFAFNARLDASSVAQALRAKLGRILEEQGLSWDNASLSRTLNLIIASDRKLLPRAWRAALATRIVCEEAAELPPEVFSPHPLEPSSLNVYGVIPPGLTSWEIQFADFLDNDMHQVVTWWHRNPSKRGPNTAYAVEIVRADGYGYYPDFVIGVNGRAANDGVALAEVKERINDRQSILKNRSEHRRYGQAKMVYFMQERDIWHRVRFDEDTETNMIVPGEFTTLSLRAD